MKKKIAVFSLLMALLLTGAVYAYQGSGNQLRPGARNGNCPQGGFTDQDNDGVCDHYEAGGCPGNGRFTDQDNDGVCDCHQGTYRKGCRNRGG